MQIGIAPNDEAVEKFNEFKFSHKLYYVIYKMAGDKEIVVDKVGDNSKNFDVCFNFAEKSDSLFLFCNYQFTIPFRT